MQSDFGRDIERPRNNSQTVRFYYPTENSHRFTTGYEASNVMGFQQVNFTGFMGTFDQRTDQDRFATATTGRTIERADISANDFHVRGAGSRLFGKARLEVGLDVNGRYDLHAVDDLLTYNLAGSLVSDRPNVSIDTARRTDTGVFASIDTARRLDLLDRRRHPRRLRHDQQRGRLLRRSLDRQRRRLRLPVGHARQLRRASA